VSAYSLGSLRSGKIPVKTDGVDGGMEGAGSKVVDNIFIYTRWWSVKVSRLERDGIGWGSKGPWVCILVGKAPLALLTLMPRQL
jgi:hypothetical protein